MAHFRILELDGVKETRILETEKEITRSTLKENWLYQRLQTCRKTDYGTIERYKYRTTATINNFPV